MKRLFPLGYFLAAIALLLVLVGFYALSSARRTQAELTRQLEQKGQALADVIETSSRNAIRSSALMEEMIAQRLLDDARLVDQLLRDRWLDPPALARLAADNRLRRIELLDLDGRPYTPPRPSPPPRPGGLPMPGPMMMMPPDLGSLPPEARRQMHERMMYLWGRRWAPPAPPGSETPVAPRAVQDRKFWQGSLFGVAVGARSFPGIIAVHADAAFVLDFRRASGVERQVEDLGHQAGVDAVALLGPDLTVVAHSDPGRVGERRDDPWLRDALAGTRHATRLTTGEGGRRVLEVLRPLALDGSRTGLLALDLSTVPMERAWSQDVRSALGLGAAVVLVGVLGLGGIFYMQHRHLADVRALEAEMERRQRLASLGDMAAAVAHEIRNPLNAVSMGLQRLRLEWKPAEADEYGRFVDVMQGEVRRLNTIVEHFLSLARPLPLKPRPLGVRDVLEELQTLVGPDAAASGVRLVLALPPELPALTADRDHLKQVLLNLVLNAVQAAPDGGTVTLAAAAARGRLTITVADTGAGIAPDTLPRIFDPYFTTKATGLGMGLAIARRIAEDHGGELTAESRVGEGSTFTLVLPLEGPPSPGA